MKNYNQCHYQYWKAVGELEAFEASDAFYYRKGYLRFKEEKRTCNNKVYTSISAYYVRVDYIDGKRKTTSKYVKKEDVAAVQRKLANKRKNRLIYKALKKKVKALLLQLKKCMGKNNKVWEAVAAHRKKKEEFRGNDKNIITILGEKVRSRAECILANLAFSFGIPYLYEAAIKIYRGFELHPDFTFIVNGRRVLLEYLGLADNDDYIANWAGKESTYREKGYVKGKNLVCIASKDPQNIDTQKISQIFIDLANGRIPSEIIYV